MEEQLEYTMTAAEALSYLEDGSLPDEFDTVLDQAQGDVNSGKKDKVTILLTITKE